MDGPLKVDVVSIRHLTYIAIFLYLASCITSLSYILYKFPFIVSGLSERKIARMLPSKDKTCYEAR